ncbi:hypothetical protein FOMA001_g16972 [Fusarium oxysporum f. sp. matthiolae]|nr:hypothetical protein FOMA001_g16972 [Fusarium oxysporum f. sp. matthiolae]
MEFPQVGSIKIPQKNILNISAMYFDSGIVCIVSAPFLVVCLSTAYFILQEWRINHYMILFAWVLTISGAITLACIHKGAPDDTIWETLVATLVVIPGTVLAKLVPCVIYYSILSKLWSRYGLCVIWASVALIIFPFAILWGALLVAASQCEESKVPCRFHWPTVYYIYMAQAGIGGLVDLTLMAVMLVNFLLYIRSGKERVTVVAFVANGLLPLVVAAARLSVLATGLKNADTTFMLANGMLFLFVESNLVIIFGSIPELRKLKKHLKRNISGRRQPSAVLDDVQGLRPRADTGYTVGGTRMN